jgi:predicted LPLAT superfamily acyltransferase
LKVLGLRLTYALSIPPAIYFSFASPDVAATMDYHRKVFGPMPWWKRRWMVFRHFFSFGQALIDRVAILANRTRRFSFIFDGEDYLREVIKHGKGLLLLTAHLGNWEAAGQLLSRLEVPVNVTGFDKETSQIRGLLDAVADTKFRLLPLTGSPTDVIPLVAAMKRGEVVAMMGDRPYGSPSERIEFLGEKASFPIGGYVMAALAGAPLIHVFSLREAGGRYHFFGFPPTWPVMPVYNARNDYLREQARGFAKNLESVLRRDPLQWYNFYPFWEETTGPRRQPFAADTLASAPDAAG